MRLKNSYYDSIKELEYEKLYGIRCSRCCGSYFIVSKYKTVINTKCTNCGQLIKFSRGKWDKNIVMTY